MFILGNQKSGTTAIATLLGAATRASTTQDFLYALPDMEQLDFIRRRLSLARFVGRHPDEFSRRIIKDNSLTFFRGELARLFPRALFVVVVRDPVQNLRSILDRLDLPGDLLALSPAHYRTLEKMVLWDHLVRGAWPPVRGANYIERMAQRWNLCADVYLNHPEDAVLVRYEDFSKDKPACIENLAARVGLSVRRDITELADVSFQPRGNPSVDLRERFGERNLATIQDLCGARARRLGYAALSGA